MKAYKATYYLYKKAVWEIVIYAKNKKQAEKLALANPVDRDDMKVQETKSKGAVDMMKEYINVTHHGEEQIIKDEIDSINRERIHLGFDPIVWKD